MEVLQWRYTKMTVGKENRTELHEKLALTGAEISLNTLPAGANVPFVHKGNLRCSFRKSTVFFPPKARSLSMAKKSAFCSRRLKAILGSPKGKTSVPATYICIQVRYCMNRGSIQDIPEKIQPTDESLPCSSPFVVGFFGGAFSTALEPNTSSREMVLASSVKLKLSTTRSSKT